MPSQLKIYTEPIQQDELIFLINKDKNRKSTYYKLFNKMMKGSFILPFFGAWYSAAAGATNAFSCLLYFTITGILLILSAAVTYTAYRFNGKHIQKDIAHKTKTIETISIIGKRHIIQNDSYYFYIASKTKFVIEVSQYDYYRRKYGDEVNIEYATYSKEYLGYF